MSVSKRCQFCDGWLSTIESRGDGDTCNVCLDIGGEENAVVPSAAAQIIAACVNTTSRLEYVEDARNGDVIATRKKNDEHFATLRPLSHSHPNGSWDVDIPASAGRYPYVRQGLCRAITCCEEVHNFLLAHGRLS